MLVSCHCDVLDCWLFGVVLVSCGCICSVYAWSNAALQCNDAGSMISVVLSYMWFIVEWCSCCCVLFVFRNVAQGVLSQVLFSVACCVKSNLNRNSISSIVLG